MRSLQVDTEKLGNLISKFERKVDEVPKGTGKNSEITEITGENFREHIIKGKNGRKNLHQTYVILLRRIINIQQMNLVE
ncbi:hypothetical protein CON93_22195 [Bacillus toyonensis]|nr:hypothetical protein CON93_22195 [Bacillus toyonensis]